MSGLTRVREGGFKLGVRRQKPDNITPEGEKEKENDSQLIAKRGRKTLKNGAR